MRTSRISQETSRVFEALSATHRRQTRNSVRSLQGFAATSNGEAIDASVEDSKTNQEIGGASGASSPLSSALSDIEDTFSPPPRKRRKGIDTPSTTISSETTTTTTTRKRVSPRKAAPSTPDDEITKAPARRAARKTTDSATGEVTTEPPYNWSEVYTLVQDMRRRVLAPVDTMGCENLYEDTRPPRVQRFQTLISLMLSSQTKDTTNAIAMRRLQEELEGEPPGLTLENILSVVPERLNQLIWVVGFHNNKTKYIKATAEILRDKFDGDIPDTVEGLMSLPGVGPKMAYLCLSAAWGKTEGIGVDVHVDRITNLWGWHQPKTKNPEETRKSLEAWLPRDKWHEINHLLVGFGQTICLPVGRKCGECLLAERKLCPAAVRGAVKKEKKKVVKKKEPEEGKVKVEIEIEEEEVVKDDVPVNAPAESMLVDDKNKVMNGTDTNTDIKRELSAG